MIEEIPIAKLDPRQIKQLESAEEAANARTVLAAAGQPALYGQAVELRHVRGGKFVTVRERALAPLEPNCLRVELDEEGGAGCWLSLLPRLNCLRPSAFDVQYRFACGQ